MTSGVGGHRRRRLREECYTTTEPLASSALLLQLVASSFNLIRYRMMIFAMMMTMGWWANPSPTPRSTMCMLKKTLSSLYYRVYVKRRYVKAFSKYSYPWRVCQARGSCPSSHHTALCAFFVLFCLAVRKPLVYDVFVFVSLDEEAAEKRDRNVLQMNSAKGDSLFRKWDISMEMEVSINLWKKMIGRTGFKLLGPWGRIIGEDPLKFS
ncbi:hypothetical protein U1Q18_050315 [Sarracenia purpurea var. burkii]